MVNKKILLCLLLSTFVLLTFARQKQSYYPFSEELYVVSNYTNLDNKWEKETRSIEDLIARGVRGFRFKFELDSNRIYARIPLDTLINAQTLLKPISNYLADNPDQLLVLFLDYTFPSEHIVSLFRELGIYQKIWIEEGQGQWPGRRLMTASGKQIVLFTMHQHNSNYNGLHYVWDYAVEPYQSFEINPTFDGDYKKGRAGNEFLFF